MNLESFEEVSALQSELLEHKSSRGIVVKYLRTAGVRQATKIFGVATRHKA